MMLIDVEYHCSFCASSNPTTVDPAAGRHQSYIEDCQTCCRPNLIHVEIDPDDPATAWIEAHPENGSE